MRVIIDFVPNHTSVEHPWFQESRSDRNHPKHDWYLWADARFDGGPPNNWIDRFGEIAWTWDESVRRYYFNSFSAQQPDLNWRHPEVREAIFNAMRFWLDRGVDGLRIDALAHLIKDEHLRDNPPNLDYNEQRQPSDKLALIYHQNQPELLDVIKQMRAVVDEYDDRVLMGEIYQSPEQITAYQIAGAQLLLSTSLLQTNFEAINLRTIVDMMEARTAVEAWPARSSGNHDIGRMAIRVGPDNLRLAAMLHLTVRGTPTIYYGEELGMGQMDVPAERMRDPSGLDNPRFGRDGHRAPMPWNSLAHQGFSEVEPWLPTDDAMAGKEVEHQLADAGSLLNFYRHLIRFRHEQPLLHSGLYSPLNTPAPIFAFTRGGNARGLLIALNIGDSDRELHLQDFLGERSCAKVLFSTIYREEDRCTTSIYLRPREGLIAQLQES